MFTLDIPDGVSKAGQSYRILRQRTNPELYI
jgi:hypothetical protein